MPSKQEIKEALEAEDATKDAIKKFGTKEHAVKLNIAEIEVTISAIRTIESEVADFGHTPEILDALRCAADKLIEVRNNTIK